MSLVPRHLTVEEPTYDLRPCVDSGSRSQISVGFDEILDKISRTGARVVVIDAYPGVYAEDLLALVKGLGPELAVDALDAFKAPAEIDRLVAPDVGDDPVFGYLTRLDMSDFLDAGRLERVRDRIERCEGRVVVYGPGASLIAAGDAVVYADLPRREATLRQRRGEVPNLGALNAGDPPSLQYKRAWFVDWRVADRHKRSLFDRMDFVIDTTDPDRPLMLEAPVLWKALSAVARRPFRVVPWFDPAPWGGRWMEAVCGVAHDEPNLGWCFDCVPEENSLLLGFGGERFETPAVNLVFREPVALLGEAVHGRFGEEFPIRFDFLDTVGGGNLSLQVHPPAGYIRERFGMSYTQDESYYVLDACPEATVYLGLRTGVDPGEMMAGLRRAERGGYVFDDERFVNRFPVRRHDHVLIPAGTVHCSGAGSLVLEISATPYIFTFKLWDWDRPGLDGRPRPVHLDHGEASIRWDRDTAYARRRLMNRVTEVGRGPAWLEERTGLHEAEFIETRRHWFRGPCPHPERSTVQVANLVEGEGAVITSPDGAFEPFEVHYAETFIVPAAAGPYTIVPTGGEMTGTITAYCR